MRIPNALAAIGIAAGFLMIEAGTNTEDGMLFDSLILIGAFGLERQIRRNVRDYSRPIYFAMAGFLAALLAALNGRDWFPPLIFAMLCVVAWFIVFSLHDPLKPRRPPD